MYETKAIWKKTVLMLIVSIGILIIIFSKIEVEVILKYLRRVKIVYLLSALSISTLINIGVGTYKWQRLLNYSGCDISFCETLFVFIHSAPLRFILPFKSGELVIAQYLKTNKNLPVLLGAGLLMVVDKIYNILAIVIYFSLGFIFLKLEIWKKCVLWSIIVLMLFIFFLQPGLMGKKWISKLLTRLGINTDVINRILESFSCFRKLKLVLCALFFQSSEVIITYILFMAMRIEIPPSALLVFVPLTIIVCNLPITISGLGTREAAFLFFYSGFATQEQLLSTGILVSFVEYFFIALIGIFTLPLFLRKL